ncbi:MAG: NTP transferase domain-containing protein [Opitutales bacterium]
MPPAWAIGILAAGHSRRFGPTPKLASPIAGKPILCHTLDAALASTASRVLMSLPSGDDGEALGRCLPAEDRLQVCVNHGNTQADSVRTLLHFAQTADVPLECVLLHPADRPALRPEAWERVLTAASQLQQPAVACIDGKLRPPLGLPRACWKLADQLQGDEGFRQLFGTLQPYPVSCDDVAADLDLDRPEDLPAFAAWLREEAS